jgi:hypothetical protein
MKKKFLLTSVFISLVFIGLAQVPNAFNYQAVVRDNSGEVVANQSVSFKLSILQGSETGTLLYAETHNVTTNGFGLANMKIGTGALLSGVFTPDGWGAASHFLKVEMDPAGGSTYTHLGTSELVSVPYAFHAQTVQIDLVEDADADPTNELQTLGLSGSDLTLSDGGGTVGLPSIWETSGANIFFNTGKVGIGKDPGADRRQFQVNAGDDQAVAAINNSATYGAIYATNTGGGPAADFRSPIRILDGNQGAGKLLTSDAGGNTSWEDPAWNQNGANAFRASGFVGIGTTTPQRHLDIHGGASSVYMGFHTDASGSASSDGFLLGMSASSTGYVWQWDNYPIQLGTSNIPRIHITGDGMVGIGTTAPTFTLSVTGTAGKTGGGSWSVFSDRRLKDLHGSYDKGLSEILALQPVVFNYKADNPLDLPSDVEEIGLVAQEVREIFPEAVTVNQNGYLDFNMHSINVAFINAIKELKSSNDELKVANDNLQEQVNDLKSRLTEIEKMLQQ